MPTKLSPLVSRLSTTSRCHTLWLILYGFVLILLLQHFFGIFSD